MKKQFLTFAIVLLAIGMIFSTGCQKYSPTAPEVEEREVHDTTTVVIDSSKTDTLYVDSTKTKVATYGLLSVIASEPDGPQVDSVRVYLKQGDPAVLVAWPNEITNYTPVNPNQMEPGSYLVVGEKEGYDQASTVVTVLSDSSNPVVAYLTMHRKAVEDTCAICPTDTSTVDTTEEVKCLQLEFDGVNTVRVKSNATHLVLDGSDGGNLLQPLINNLLVENGWSVYVIDSDYTYNLVTVRWEDQWYHYNLTDCLQIGDNLREQSDNNQWYELIYLPEPDPDPNCQVNQYGWVPIDVEPNGANIYLDGQPWSEGVSTTSVGQHVLKVSKESYVSQSVEFYVNMCDTVDLQPIVLEEEISDCEANNYGWMQLVITPSNSTIFVDDRPWGDGLSPLPSGAHTLIVSKVNFVSDTIDVWINACETTNVNVDLEEEPSPPPPDNPLKVEFISGNIVRLSGGGHEKWLGIETWVGQDVNDQGPPWYNNQWILGTDKGSYTEFVMPAESVFKYAHFWSSVIPGEEGNGGSGISPSFTGYSTLIKGAGVESIQRTGSGHIVLER